MANNQTCYKCGQPCRPGRGITDGEGRRHEQCPPPNPDRVERKRQQMVKTRAEGKL